MTRTPPKQGAGTCMRAGGSGRARKGNRMGKHQHLKKPHFRDAPIKYNENYAIANEVERKLHNTSLC